MTDEQRTEVFCAAIDTIIINAPEVASEGIKLKQIVRKTPNSPLIARRLGILYNNATGAGSDNFDTAAKRQIGEALVIAGGEYPTENNGEGLTERFEMKVTPEQKAWILQIGGASVLRSLIDAARQK